MNPSALINVLNQAPRGAAIVVKADFEGKDTRSILNATFTNEPPQVVLQLTVPPVTTGTKASDIAAQADVAQLIRERDGWTESAAQHLRNEQYYRGLVVAIGELFGKAAYTSDDGSVQQDVLCAKVPELVAGLVHRSPVDRLRDIVAQIEALHAAAPAKYLDDALGLIKGGLTCLLRGATITAADVQAQVPDAVPEPAVDESQAAHDEHVENAVRIATGGAAPAAPAAE